MRMVCGLKRAPTGFCIQALAIRIHSADRLEPSATSQVTTRWPILDSRSQPKKNRPTKVDFQEERHQALDRQRRAEDVADVVGVVGPVGAELELHGDAGRDPHGEVDAEQQAPELRHALPDLAARHDVDALHDGEQHGQAERQRHEQEVIQRGQRELQPRERARARNQSRRSPGCGAAASAAAARPGGCSSASRRPVVAASTRLRWGGEKNSHQSNARAATLHSTSSDSSRRRALRQLRMRPTSSPVPIDGCPDVIPWLEESILVPISLRRHRGPGSGGRCRAARPLWRRCGCRARVRGARSNRRVG